MIINPAKKRINHGQHGCGIDKPRIKHGSNTDQEKREPGSSNARLLLLVVIRVSSVAHRSLIGRSSVLSVASVVFYAFLACRVNKDGRKVSLEDARKETTDILKKRPDGEITLAQYFVFADQRTGVTEAAPAKVPNSGFEIVEERKIDPTDGKRKIFVKKMPKANNGVQPGSMPQSATQQFSAPLE